jgi:transcriptional regulator with XRE-family HTH domain
MSISIEKIVSLRKERGWSQEKLAAVSGVSERTIHRVESDGACSLDTKMALASAFEVAPSALLTEPEMRPSVQVKQVTSWSGAIGLFPLGLLAPLVILLTATDGKWEMSCAGIVWGLTLVLSIMNFGAKATYRLFDNTSWIVRYPSYVSGLNIYIIQARTVIEYSYIVGAVASIVCALTIATHAPSEVGNTTKFFAYSIRPLIYAILFVELWFRPYKKKMETMLLEQTLTSKFSS